MPVSDNAHRPLPPGSATRPGRAPYHTDGTVIPRVEDGDGPHFQLFQCGAEYNTQARPTQPQFLNAVDPQGAWIHVVQGAVYFKLDGKKHRIGAGETLVMRQPNPGWFLRPGEEMPVYTLWINVAGDMALRVFDYLSLKYGTIQRMPSTSEPVILARRLIRRVARQPLRPAHAWSAMTFEWMNAWWRFAAAHHAPARQAMSGPLRPSRLLSFSSQTVKNFAAQIGYSRAHLTRKLSEQWEESPGRVLRRVRLEEAARLLRTTRLSVGDVAVKVGYSGSDAFSRAFSRQYKQSPLAYRHAHP